MIGGSTRMKAGTAQKIVLNLFSTAVMVRLGRVYKGMMVDFRATNAKLRRRSEDMVAKIANCDAARAKQALIEAEGEVKLAALVALGARREEAKARLATTAAICASRCGRCAKLNSMRRQVEEMRKA